MEQLTTQIKMNKLILGSIICSYILAYLYVKSFVFGDSIIEGMGIAPTTGTFITRLLFAVVFVLWGEIVSYKKLGLRGSRESYFWMSCTLLISLSFLIGGNLMSNYYGTDMSIAFSYCMLHGIAAYWVLCRFQLLMKMKTSGYFLWDSFGALVILPFSSFFLRLIEVKTMVKVGLQCKMNRKIEKRNVGISFLVIGITMLLLFMVTRLLGQSDQNFARIFNFVMKGIKSPKIDWGICLYIILSLPVGAYLFGLIQGAYKRETSIIPMKIVENGVAKLRVVSVNMLVVALSLFCLIYGLYILLQASYFFGAFTGKLPVGFTFAEYARQGFFELCMILALNLGIFIVIRKVCLVEIQVAKGLFVCLLIFMGESMIFVITAFSKLLFYIEAYGFTTLRVMSLWAIIVLMMAVGLAIASMYGVKEVARKWILFTAGTFTILSFL